MVSVDNQEQTVAPASIQELGYTLQTCTESGGFGGGCRSDVFELEQNFPDLVRSFPSGDWGRTTYVYWSQPQAGSISASDAGTGAFRLGIFDYEQCGILGDFSWGGCSLETGAALISSKRFRALFNLFSGARYVDDAAALTRIIEDLPLNQGPELLSAAGRQLDGLVACMRSFAPSTEVLLADGTSRRFAELEVGDVVWATNPHSGESGPKRIEAVWPHEDSLIVLDLASGSVTTTEDHRFWNVTDGEWSEAQDLSRASSVLSSTGEPLAVRGLDWQTQFWGQAFDLTVEGFHSYYVAAGDEFVLVHNCSLRAWDIAMKTEAKHGLLGFRSIDDLATHIDDVVASAPGHLRNDGSLIYRAGDNFIVIPDSARTPGTIFRPNNPDAYWEIELGRTGG